MLHIILLLCTLMITTSADNMCQSSFREYMNNTEIIPTNIFGRWFRWFVNTPKLEYIEGIYTYKCINVTYIISNISINNADNILLYPYNSYEYMPILCNISCVIVLDCYLIKNITDTRNVLTYIIENTTNSINNSFNFDTYIYYESCDISNFAISLAIPLIIIVVIVAMTVSLTVEPETTRRFNSCLKKIYKCLTRCLTNCSTRRDVENNL